MSASDHLPGKYSATVELFSGIAGYLTLLAGADVWSAGWYRSERRLRLVDIEDADGRAYPAYSHVLASEIHTREDLDIIYKAGFFDEIKEQTPVSELLHNALDAGRKASSVPEWTYRMSNIVASKEHFVHAAINQTANISGFDKNDLFAYGLDWLSKAKDLADQISKLSDFHDRTSVDHQSSWYNTFKRFTEEVG